MNESTKLRLIESIPTINLDTLVTNGLRSHVDLLMKLKTDRQNVFRDKKTTFKIMNKEISHIYIFPYQ